MNRRASIYGVAIPLEVRLTWSPLDEWVGQNRECERKNEEGGGEFRNGDHRSELLWLGERGGFRDPGMDSGLEENPKNGDLLSLRVVPILGSSQSLDSGS
jgi:hypothetical protein